MLPLDCTRHLLAVSSEVCCSVTSPLPAAPELSTHSGSSPRVEAVAWACSFQPPGGSRLPKNELRVPSTATVTLELSAAIVVVIVDPFPRRDLGQLGQGVVLRAGVDAGGGGDAELLGHGQRCGVGGVLHRRCGRR